MANQHADEIIQVMFKYRIGNANGQFQEVDLNAVEEYGTKS